MSASSFSANRIAFCFLLPLNRIVVIRCVWYNYKSLTLQLKNCCLSPMPMVLLIPRFFVLCLTLQSIIATKRWQFHSLNASAHFPGCRQSNSKCSFFYIIVDRLKTQQLFFSLAPSSRLFLLVFAPEMAIIQFEISIFVSFAIKIVLLPIGKFITANIFTIIII